MGKFAAFASGADIPAFLRKGAMAAPGGQLGSVARSVCFTQTRGD